MKNTIKNLTLVWLMAALTACGGSSSSSDPVDPADAGEPTDTPVDPIADVPNDKVGLGSGVGETYENGVATTALLAGESLSASGSTTVSVDIVNLENANAEFLGLRNVYFLSTCTQVGLAEFTPATLQASGKATATYKDKGCGKELGATDNVVVYIGTDDGNGVIIADATARTTIDVSPAQVGAVQFVSASPSLIALNGFGTESTPALSEIKFLVVDESGNPMPDRTIVFSLDHEYGLAKLSLSSAITDQEGFATVILNAGNASGTIRIKAGVDIKDAEGVVTGSITTMSIPVTMATSLADENSSGIAIDVRNPSAWNLDGTKSNVTVHLGDHYQNPVIDGTTVYFRATGGIIEPQCETSGGFCSVVWSSANPRPVDGYVTIVAYTRGQGSFQDKDSDGLFDLGESFTSFGEEYIDANGNGSFEQGGAYQPDLDINDDGINDFSWNDNAYQVNVDSSGTYVVAEANFLEEFIDSNSNGVLDQAAGSLYQGVNCAADAIAAGHCAEQIDIVLSTRLQMSQSNSALIEGPFLWNESLRTNYQTSGRFDTSEDAIATCVDASTTGGSKFLGWRVADSSQRRNSLPNETKVSLSSSDVDVLQTSVANISNHGAEYVLPVWEVLWDAQWDEAYNAAWVKDTAANNGKSNAVRDTERATFKTANLTAINTDKKYDYLNSRGHLFSATVLRPKEFTTVTGVGTLNLEVDTNHGSKKSSNTLEVDLEGRRIILASKIQGTVSSIDVSDVAQDFTLFIQNHCGKGLIGGKLAITTSNGVISAAGSQGSASNHSITSNVLIADVDNSGEPTVLTFTLTKDAPASVTAVANALSITHRVEHPTAVPTIEIFNELADYPVTD